MTSIIDSESLSKAKITSPHSPFVAYKGVFREDIDGALFPKDHFEYHAQRKLLEALGKKNTDAWYQHNVRTRALLKLGESSIFEADTLSSIWHKVAIDLLSTEYREAISEAAQFDVTNLDFQAHFWEFGQGAFFQPHIDKPHKIVTHLMYLTENWTPEVGGELKILGSSNDQDIIENIPPIKNTSVILKRTENAWHSVGQIPHNSPAKRRLLQVWFWKS